MGAVFTGRPSHGRMAKWTSIQPWSACAVRAILTSGYLATQAGPPRKPLAMLAARFLEYDDAPSGSESTPLLKVCNAGEFAVVAGYGHSRLCDAILGDTTPSH